jgi:hypothetical protein
MQMEEMEVQEEWGAPQGTGVDGSLELGSPWGAQGLVIKIDGTFLVRHKTLVDAITESDEDAAEKAMGILLDISHKEDLQTLRKED